MAEIPDQPPEKTRQEFRLVRPERCEQVPQFLKRVAGPDLSAAAPAELHAVPGTGKGQERIKADKRVAAPLLPPFQTFEQEGMGVVRRHLGKNGQRRIEVCHYFPVNRDETCFARQFSECLKVRLMHDFQCPGE